MIIVWILIVLIMMIILLDQFIKRMYRYESNPHRESPEKYNVSYEEITIPLPQKGYLYGWWIPTSLEAPTLILVHGWSRNLSRMLPYIQKLHLFGYNLLAFDARNHGSSSGVKHPTVETFTEDTLAAVDYIAERYLGSNGEIGVVGLSIGGGAAINAAVLDPRIKSVVTVGALSHPYDVMKMAFQKRNIPDWILQFLFIYMKIRFGIDFNQIAPVNNIANAGTNILLIHGEQDATIPLIQGKALMTAGATGKTNLWVVPDKGHSDCDTHPDFWNRVGVFLQGTIPVQTK